MQQRRLAAPSMAQRLETTGTEFERNGFVVSKEEREDPVYLPEAVYAEIKSECSRTSSQTRTIWPPHTP